VAGLQPTILATLAMGIPAFSIRDTAVCLRSWKRQTSTPLLKGARGGLKAVLGAMRFSKDSVVGRFLAKHDCLGVWERQNTPWEAVALAAGVDLPYLLGAALLARRDDATTRTELIAICNAPELIKKRIEYAMLPGGWRDRDALEKLVLGWS